MTVSGRMISLVAGALLAAVSLPAQRAVSAAIDPNWRPFLGCWATSAAGSRGPTVCLLPGDSANRIEMVTISNDSILSRSTVTSGGERVPVTRDGCTGWESGRWSQDDRRFFTRAEFSCGGAATQSATGMYAMVHPDAFTRIEGVKTKGATRTRVVNFAWIDAPRVPAEIASRLPGVASLSLDGTRVEAAAAITTADVVEASKAVDAGVVEAWIADRGQPFAVAARDLRALRDAGVATSVIDMVVAVSHPKVFVVAPGAAPGTRLPDLTTRNRNGMGFAEREAYEREIRMLRLQSAFAYGWGDTMFPFYGLSSMYGGGFFSPFNTGFYGNGFYNGGLAFNNFYGNYFNGYPNTIGNGFYNGGVIIGNGPYVIAPVRPAQPDPGRVVNGGGYSQNGGGSGGGVARPTPSVSSGGYSNGGSSTSGGASAGSARGASAGGGEARTAKPRP